MEIVSLQILKMFVNGWSKLSMRRGWVDAR